MRAGFDAVGSRRIAWLTLVALMVVDTALLLYVQHGLTFFVDEWRFLSDRREWNVDTFLRPSYEHLSIVTLLVFKVLMSTTGIGPHWAYELPLIASHLACVTLVYVFARRRIGDWFALAPAILILFLGYAADDLLQPIQLSFVGTVAVGLGVLLLLDSDGSRGRDAAACLLLAIALASSSLALPFAIAGAVLIVMRPRWQRRLWIVLAPLGIYAIWFVFYGPRGLQQGGDLRGNIPFVPSYVADSAAAAFGAVSGLGPSWGRVLAVIAAIFAVRYVLSSGRMSPPLVATTLGLLSYWVLGALARAHEHNPEASRYLYPAAVFIVIIAAELLSFIRLEMRWASVLTLVVAFAVVGNLNILRGNRDTLQIYTHLILAQFAALETLGRDAAPPDFVAGKDLAPGIGAARYFAMIDQLGSPTDVKRDILDRGDKERSAADAVLARALSATAQPDVSVAEVEPSPLVVRRDFGDVTRSGPCVRLDASNGEDAHLVVAERGPGVVIHAPGVARLRIAIRRFGREFQDVAGLAGRSSLAVALPGGGLAITWQIRVSGQGVRQICTSRPPPSGT